MAVSLDEAREKLQAFVAGEDGIAELYRGQVKRNRETLSVFAADEDMEKAMATTVDVWVAKGKFGKLLDLWVKGLVLDWSTLYGEVKPRRMSLPTYPFAREQYWIPQFGGKSVRWRKGRRGAAACAGAPEYFGLAGTAVQLDVQRRRILPGGPRGQRRAGIAGGGVSGNGAGGGAAGIGHRGRAPVGVTLKNVVWSRPVVVQDTPVEVHIGLYPEENGEIAYEIYSTAPGAEDEPVVHSQGVVQLGAVAAAESVDLTAVQAQCQQQITAAQCYDAFGKMGIVYGPGQRALSELHLGQGQVLAKLDLPVSVLDTQTQYGLHPSLLDAALQACIGLSIGSGSAAALPFALEGLDVLHPCTRSMWAVVRAGGSAAHDKVQKLDIDLCDADGVLCVRIEGLCIAGAGWCRGWIGYRKRHLAAATGMDSATRVRHATGDAPRPAPRAVVRSDDIGGTGGSATGRPVPAGGGAARRHRRRLRALHRSRL